MLCYVVVGLSFILYFTDFCVILHPDVGRLLNFPLRLREIRYSGNNACAPSKNLFIILFIFIKLKVKI